MAKAHKKVANQRKDFLHKLSRRLVNDYDLVVLEDLRIGNMLKNSYLSKSIGDASWGTLIGMLGYKAAEDGGLVVRVDPKGTPQACSGCGAYVPKGLSARVHSCPRCGLVLDRDVNAAVKVLRRGLDKIGLTVGQGLPEPNACGDGSSTPPPALAGRGGASHVVEAGSSAL